MRAFVSRLIVDRVGPQVESVRFQWMIQFRNKVHHSGGLVCVRSCSQDTDDNYGPLTIIKGVSSLDHRDSKIEQWQEVAQFYSTLPFSMSIFALARKLYKRICGDATKSNL